jgi:hypothetical protein
MLPEECNTNRSSLSFWEFSMSKSGSSLTDGISSSGRIPIETQFLLMCAGFWRNSSPALQKKYQAHARDEQELRAVASIYNALGVDFNEALAPARELLHRLTSIPATPPTALSTRRAGEYLQSISFTQCRLGGPASWGDLELYFKDLESTHELDSSQLSPLTQLELYRKGNHVYVCLMLNKMLSDVGEKLSASGYAEPALWEEDEGGWLLCRDVLTSGYHLIQSFLCLIESPYLGHA